MKTRKQKKIGDKDSEFLFQTRVICKCGHTLHFFTKNPYMECSHCHQIVFRDKKAEYDYKLKRRLGILK